MHGRAVSSVLTDVSRARASLLQKLRRHFADAASAADIKQLARPTLLSLLLVAAATVGLVGLQQFAELPHVSIVYLIPVLFSSTRWGVFPAVVAAVASI